ncbi:sulfite exporter TauE/SafE family protein [Alcaligenes phenolicus]|uniref:Probable membrane transporter protein n=1 Tax=Alcaligenes phenolicus TaxID=232846 RepID=A0AAW5VND6_9BURK|nr:sulfite exporter TauE/SafE family protein [Alcaligenes phenolicus]MCX5565679.1 sulfite exporter TauE/SafE family protein [Alcaligenes phenolicus]
MPDSIALLPLHILTLLILVAMAAGVMRGFSGFGGGLLIAPVYSLFISPTDVVVLVMLLNLLTTVQLLPQVLRNVHWPTVFSLVITAALLGVPIGVAVLHRVDPVLMRKAIAGIVCFTSVLLLWGWNYKGRRGRIQDGIVGFFCGLLTSIGGVGGPPIIIYLLSDTRLSQHAFRAIVIMLFLLLQVWTLAQFGMTGALTAEQGIYTLMLLPVYALAHWIGEKAFLRYGHQQAEFRRIALWCLMGVGLIAFVI